MARIGNFVRWVTLPSQPVTVNHLTVTPLAQALIIDWPRGGFVWNRPVALLVAKDGQTARVSIPDVTRRTQLALLGIGSLLSLILWAASHKEVRL